MAATQGDSMGATSEDKIGESSQGSSEALRRILTDLDEAAQDVAGGEGYPASWLDSMAATQGDSMGATSEDKIGESSQGSSEALRRILTDLDEAAQELNPETVEALQEGTRQGAPASGGKRGAYSSVDEPAYRILPAGVDEKKNPNAADQNEFWKPCTEGITAVLGSMLLGMVFCCVIHLWRKRRRRIAEASASQANIDRRTWNVESRMPHSKPSEHGTQQPRWLPEKPPGRPLRCPPRPPPPQASWLSHSANRVLQGQHSSLDLPKTEEPAPQPPKPPDGSWV
ncbi:uncharacterized protein PRD47_011330 [Ara ararauna]